MSRESHEHIVASQIKCVAKAIEKDENIALALLSARPDAAPKGLRVIVDGAETYLPQCPLAWVSGSSGSGKTEAANSWLRDAVTSGRPAVMVTTETRFWSQWHPEDVLIIQEYERDLIRDRVRRSERPFTLIVSKPPQTDRQGGSVMRDMFLDALDALPRDGLLVADEMHWGSVPDRETLTSLNSGQLILLAQSDEAIRHLRRPEDGFFGALLPRNTIPGDPRADLRTGEAFYEALNVRIKVDFPYHPDLFGASFLRKPERLALSKLEPNKEALRRVTHMEKLEAVARACGYRSWHAAQGRR